MALNFPDSPVNGSTYTDPNGIIYTYNSTKGYWSTSDIDSGGGGAAPNDATITLSPGTGLIGGGNFTTNQSSNETITFNIDLNELSTSTTNGDGDYFVVVDTSGVERKLTKGNIAISGFSNDSGYITSADGGNAATLDSIDSSQFLRSDTADTSTGSLTFNGNVRINSELLDAGGGAGSSGQILASTGSGVDWIDAPTGGGASAINDLTDVTITSPSSGQVLKYNGSAWVNGTDETSAGGSGITTGKAIAMAMVFG